MKRLLLAGLLSLFVSSPAWGQVAWTAAFEATPADGDLVSLGDDRIRELKSTVREQLTTEHDTSNIGGLTDTARHHLGSARPFFQAAAPATLVHTDADASNALDDSRLWVDTDDGQPYFYDLTPTTPIGTNYTAAAGFFPLWPRSYTTTDVATDDNQQGAVVDTREAITGLEIAITTPDDGRDYEIVVTGTCTFYLGTGEAIGCWLVQDVGPIDWDFKLAEAPGGANGHLASELTVTGTNAAPGNGTIYTFTIEYACSVATSDNCVVNPEEGLGNVAAQGGDFNALTSWSSLTAELRPRATHDLVGGTY